MPDQNFTSWVHGSSMQVEYPESRTTSVRHAGPFGRIEGTKGQNTWVHLPVPTPTVVNGTKTRVGAALISFRTRSHVKVVEVIVYDGDKRIAEHLDMNLKSENFSKVDARFEVSDTPEVNQGLNIVVGVVFGDDAPDVRSLQIEILGGGIEFLA